MGFLSRLRRSHRNVPHSVDLPREQTADERAEEERQARIDGRRDARKLPPQEFLDPAQPPPWVRRRRARADEKIAEVEENVTRRGVEIAKEIATAQSLIEHYNDFLANGSPHQHNSPGENKPHADEESFVSFAEAQANRERRKKDKIQQDHAFKAASASEEVRRAKAALAHLLARWDGVRDERDRQVLAISRRTDQLISCYREGVVEKHPRRGEVPRWAGDEFSPEETLTALKELPPSGKRFQQEIQRAQAEIESFTNRQRRQITGPNDQEV